MAKDDKARSRSKLPSLVGDTELKPKQLRNANCHVANAEEFMDEGRLRQARSALDSAKPWADANNATMAIYIPAESRYNEMLTKFESCADDDSAHSIDFRSVRWNGISYTFNASQAICVSLLWAAWKRGVPDLGESTLLEAVDHAAPPTSLRNLFRYHPAWGEMIVAGGSKGSHRLTRR